MRPSAAQSMENMIRLATIFLLLHASFSTSQDNSDITYVKIRPIVRPDPQIPVYFRLRESRIENLPLTIGTFQENVRRTRSENVKNSELNEEPATEKTFNYPTSDTDDTNFRYPTSDTNPTGVIPIENNTEVVEKNVTDIRTMNNENSTTTDAPSTKRPFRKTFTSPPRPKFYQKKISGERFAPKLSYFSRNDLESSLSTNVIIGDGRRRFRSRCRCERIWNCPKLQISVPRCPEEYFMCCF